MTLSKIFSLLILNFPVWKMEPAYHPPRSSAVKIKWGWGTWSIVDTEDHALFSPYLCLAHFWMYLLSIAPSQITPQLGSFRIGAQPCWTFWLFHRLRLRCGWDCRRLKAQCGVSPLPNPCTWLLAGLSSSRVVRLRASSSCWFFLILWAFQPESLCHSFLLRG